MKIVETTRYPYIVFLHNDPEIEQFFEQHREQLNCTLFFIREIEELTLLYNSSYQILITYKTQFNCTKVIANRMRNRWIHFNEINDIQAFNRSVNYCFIHNCSISRIQTRPTFSVFITCYNSFEKIYRAYNSILSQTFQDYEVVVVDDSPDDNHFEFLRKTFSGDHKIRLYRRDTNSGNIGNVKNEAVSLCRGKYIMEMDHDDCVLPHVLTESVKYFENNLEVGFVYTDFINIYENGNNYKYSDFLSLGYGSYYCQKYNGKWVYVYNTPQINNITLSHLVSCPNHPRIWKTSVLLEAGNYSEMLPICDDFEILLRTAAITKMAKLFTMGYVQYMNENNNNFSLIRNSEINRIGPHFIRPIFYESLKIHERMKQLGGYEDPKYIHQHSEIWKRKDYTPSFANKIHCLYKKQVCVIGIDNIERVLPLNPEWQYLVLDTIPIEKMWEILDSKGLDIHCYSRPTRAELKDYFLMMYRCCEDYQIIETKPEKILITGTGRCGTTFLVRLFSYLQFDTGFDETNFDKFVNEVANSGLEKHHDEDHYIIKNPVYLEIMEEIVNLDSLIIKNVILPIRNFEDSAKSRVSHEQNPGGLWQANNEKEQIEFYNKILSKYIYTMTKYDIATTFIDFDRMVTDKNYLFEKVKSILLEKSITFETFSEMYDRASNDSKPETFPFRHLIINKNTTPENVYLEIGVEYGQTFEKVHFINKTGVDPDPKCQNDSIVRLTSDNFFTTNKKYFDVIFIDGMHQVEYVVRDLNNSIGFLNPGGVIFIDDILPLNEEEQLKVPKQHKIENGILKYISPWTGDVWKVVYYLLQFHKQDFSFEYFTHENYRGVAQLTIKNQFIIPESQLETINGYTYSLFGEYIKLL
jgi:glycosyltransferase involved in cell wall biosynthesis